MAALAGVAAVAHKHGKASGFKLGEAESHQHAREVYTHNGMIMAQDQARHEASQENDKLVRQIVRLENMIPDADGDVFYD